MVVHIITQRIDAIRAALAFYSEIFELIGFELYTPAFLRDEEGNRVYGEDDRPVRLEQKPLFTHTNVVDISDPNSVINYWASNYDLASDFLSELFDYSEAYCPMEYCDYERDYVPSFRKATPEQVRVIMDKLTEAETLMAHSRTIREMVQIE